MRRRSVLVATALLVIACGQAPPSITPHSATASASPAVSGSASPPSASSPSPGAPLTGPYGLVLAAGTLNLVKTDGTVFASVTVAAPSVQFCSSAHDGAVLAAPVSASNDQVYFRDGDTRIRMVVSPSSATDVTTVPGGATTVSFFSVSPDDQRIAVVVEDLSAATTIKLRLYVEDLHGGGHHADIYSTSQPKNGTTIWPMGWHQGALVLAIVRACTFEPVGLTPTEWHVSSAVTAVRIATIRSSNYCVLSSWPSPAGVGCINSASGATTLYDWTGKATAGTGPPTRGPGYTQTGLSPAGSSAFFSVGAGYAAPPPATQILQLGPGPYATVKGHSACLWIDEDHLLAPDAVIQFPSTTPGNVQVNATVTPLAASGVCAGRFPGGL